MDCQNTVRAIYEHGIVKFGQLPLPFRKKYVKNIPSITVLYTIKGVSSCNSGQSQRPWVPIQTKSIVTLQATIEKSLLCHRSKIEKGP